MEFCGDFSAKDEVGLTPHEDNKLKQPEITPF